MYRTDGPSSIARLTRMVVFMSSHPAGSCGFIQLIALVRFHRSNSSLVCLMKVTPQWLRDFRLRSLSPFSPFGLRLDLIFWSTSFHAQPRSHLVLSLTRFAAFVSVHAGSFPVWFSSSPPGRHTEGCASPRRAHLICAPLSRHHFSASA
jgi:hypothetical protein